MRRSHPRSISFRLLKRLMAVAFGAAIVSPATAEVKLTLKDAFIEKYKHQSSIEDQRLIDHSQGKTKAAFKDGYIHVAVRCPKEIALALIARIMNTLDQPEATSTKEARWRLGSIATSQIKLDFMIGPIALPLRDAASLDSFLTMRQGSLLLHAKVQQGHPIPRPEG